MVKVETKMTERL